MNVVRYGRMKKLQSVSQKLRMIPAEKALATKRQTRISREEFEHVNALVRSATNTPLASKFKLEKTRKELEAKIDYIIGKHGNVFLNSVSDTMAERRKRLGMQNDTRGFDVLFSLDNGRGRVVATLSHVYHPRPCSYYNHLPVNCWVGKDNYEALKQREIESTIRILINMGYRVFLGGELSFLSTSYGLSCAMTFGCLWCNKPFARGKGAMDSIDFKVYESRSDPGVEEEIKKFKFVAPKKPLIDIDRNFVVPPILHAKILIGNELFERLLAVSEDLIELKPMLVKWKLYVNRHEEGIIYSRFHGNDIKRLCQAIGDLKAVSNSTKYQKIIRVFEVFDVWCRLVSNTNIGLADEQCREISCRQQYLPDYDCCQTARLGQCLDEFKALERVL